MNNETKCYSLFEKERADACNSGELSKLNNQSNTDKTKKTAPSIQAEIKEDTESLKIKIQILKKLNLPKKRKTVR